MNFRFFVVIAIFSFILSCDKKVKPLQLNTSWSYSGYFEDENSKHLFNSDKYFKSMKTIITIVNTINSNKSFKL